MSKVIKPSRSGIRILYYCSFCVVLASLLAVQSFRLIESGSSRIDFIISILIGSFGGLLLLSPVINNIKKILKAVTESISLKKEFSTKISFPLELAQLADEVKDLRNRSYNSNIELTRQDTTRRELLANAAHDIKGPLTAISGYLEDCFTRLETGDTEVAKKSLEVCIKNSRHLERIVLEIFEAAKFDNLAGNLALEVAAIDEFLGDIVQKFSARAERESKKLLFKAAAQNSLVHIDLGLLERALSNLIDNALKYTDADGQVTIGSRLEADTVLLYVSDSGKGIPEKDLPHIFERLYRVERDRSKEAKGSGFGLSIAKKIIEAHAGNIMCSSNPGAGTVFQISIPVLAKEKVAEAMAELISKRG